MKEPLDDLFLFVATRRDDVPRGCERYVSVDGSVPGAAVVWDHHVTGESINLDAMPSRIDLEGMDGIGTTAADTDAVASAAVALLGGAAAVPAPTLAVLAAASHRCDHLAPHPDVDAEADRLGIGLHEQVGFALRGVSGLGASETFAGLVKEIAEAVRSGAELPFRAPEPDDARVAELVAARRIERRGALGLADLRGVPSVDPAAVHRRSGARLTIFVDDHPSGGVRYTVGVNPFDERPLDDLGPALAALAAAEAEYGPPCLGPEPLPGRENWGGRATVFGSPWNYGSRLSPDEVVRVVAGALTLTG